MFTPLRFSIVSLEIKHLQYILLFRLLSEQYFSEITLATRMANPATRNGYSWNASRCLNACNLACKWGNTRRVCHSYYTGYEVSSNANLSIGDTYTLVLQSICGLALMVYDTSENLWSILR